MADIEIKERIKSALQSFSKGDLFTNATRLFNTMDYSSRRFPLAHSLKPAEFLETYNPDNRINPDKAHYNWWQSIHFIFQITGDEIKNTSQIRLDFGANHHVDKTIIESYLFFALELIPREYTRTELAEITRQINKGFDMPVMLLFKYGSTLTLGIIDRRLNKIDSSKDVLKKVTLIKDINVALPHRAHVEILFDLSINELYRNHQFTNFVELHRAWEKTLDSSEVNKAFFKELTNWYFWALQNVTFPQGAGEDEEVRNATSVIRLLTRVIFIWFIKEKGLVPDELFNDVKLKTILKYNDPRNSTYYKAILQNLFFATLNQEMNTPEKPNNRQFRGKSKQPDGRDQHYGITNLYRYENYFQNPSVALNLFSQIPFLNGGLFECLDKPEKDDPKKMVRIDGFSDYKDSEIEVPDFLFFNPQELEVDLNDAYGTSHKTYKVRGLINLLGRYKFTINENTPIEEEIALDPELLGKVFENLLASYNPETKTTARKATGSYYTPREIVNYMVDESLIAYLANYLKDKFPEMVQVDSLENDLREMFAYKETKTEGHYFDSRETGALIDAIDTVKVLDPSCGSGAFPMGILHKLVFILGKLDPHNHLWKERQLTKYQEIEDPVQREKAITDTEDSFQRNEMDYGRKLYLIQNCIYGVDIQPIAVQIAKLRFFISLVVDQKLDEDLDNRGILPLPNLETKFVAANTLIELAKPKLNQKLSLRSPAVIQKEQELASIRKDYFAAKTPVRKRKYREIDAKLRNDLGELLKEEGFPGDTAEKLALWDPYDQNKHVEWFDPEWMFGLNRGFDVVIANPPYVRQEEINYKPALQQEYSIFNSVSDLYTYFYEKGMKLLNSFGVLTFITSNKFLRARYGINIRKYLKTNTSIKSIINFGDQHVFDAINNTLIFIATKQKDEANIFNYSQNINDDNIIKFQQFELRDSEWTISSPDVIKLKTKIELLGVPLSEWNVRINYGIKTGYNDAFIIDETTKNDLIKRDLKSKEIIKPIIRGRDIKRYYFVKSGQYLIVTHNGYRSENNEIINPININKYPAVKNHFTNYINELEERQDQGVTVYHLRDCAFMCDFAKEKIIWLELTNENKFAYSNKEDYLLAGAFFMAGESLKYLLTFLNSKLCLFYFSLICNSSGMATMQWKKFALEKMPVMKLTDDEQKPFIEIVNKILAIIQANDFSENLLKQKQVKEYECEIDKLFYELYSLTPEEIAVVEGEN